MPPLQNAGLFLVQVLFDLYIFVILLRIILQRFRIDFYNPISQWVLKLTNPPLMPLRRYIPSYAGIDIPAIGLLLALQLTKFSLLYILQVGLIPNIAGLIIIAFADSIAQLVNLFFYAILISVVMSWINPNPYNPILTVIIRITEPLMAPVRRIIPPIGGMDITPIPVMIGLKLIEILLIAPLFAMGRGLL